MNQELIQSFMLKYGECFDTPQIADIQQKLADVDDSKSTLFLSLNLHKPTVILIIAILLGFDRFFLDDVGLGVVKVLTCYGIGIWWLIDIFSAKKRTYEYNLKKFNEALLLAKAGTQNPA